MLEPLIAHGGTAGAVVELSLALLIVAIALAVWVGRRTSRRSLSKAPYSAAPTSGGLAAFAGRPSECSPPAGPEGLRRFSV